MIFKEREIAGILRSARRGGYPENFEKGSLAPAPALLKSAESTGERVWEKGAFYSVLEVI